METKIRDRGWVKNVAIVFLSVMLVLTFFSNTIMNRSLPEVATQSIGSNTITAQVRGTGKVSATQNYEVKIDQTRTVKSVMVKVGQEVNAGDVLFVLSDMESDELEAAQDNLRSLSTSYQKALLNATESDYAKENRDIKRAKENLEEAEQKRDELVAVTDMDVIAAETALNAAKDKVKEAQKKLDRAEEDLRDVGSPSDANDAKVTQLIRERDDAQKEYDAIFVIYGQKYEKIQALADEYIKEYDEGYEKANNKENYLKQHRDNYMQYVVENMQIIDGTIGLPSNGSRENAISDNEQPVPFEGSDDEGEGNEDTKDKGEGAKTEVNNKDDPNEKLLQEYKTAYEKVSGCEKKLANAKAEYLNALDADNSSEYNSASRAVKKAQENFDAADEARAEAEERLNEIKNKRTEYENDYKSAVETVKSCQISLEDLVFALQEQQKADNKAAQMEKLDIQDLAAQVGKAQKRVNELREDSGSREITAEVPGVIESIGITAGNKTTPDTPLATIELPDMGYTMSFSVTNEQARLIHAGDSATVSNYYYGSQITATVSSVKTDPKNPQTSKLVTFDVSGDVNVGADLTVSVGQRSQEYDFVVPNSALRSDANGDFILVITAKNSPLGNRYIATRVDVSKVASDDTSTAVTGALNRGDFVITTSTKPIENGQQVRMQDT
ncbi:MAG: HlyD family efflux transporter periplasmic adaptor subunit [Butyricicoccus sp.]|nr:HlyD family efflux transporter periplasmic adaptor subunit [Butyricicoccus sp.]